MLHEYIVELPLKKVDEAIELLNAKGLFNHYYEPPIENIKIQNGYAFKEKEESFVELKIYAEENEMENLPEAYFPLIEQALNIERDQIQYHKFTQDEWNYSLDDIDLGNGWVIQYVGSQYEYPNKNVLHFDPQGAFGTGLHETTQDCLRIILEKDFNGKSILDLGTGSGMLSVGAGIKQANSITAIDLQTVEREIKHNAELNAIPSTLQVIEADLINGDYEIEDDFDWIFINIGADETVEIIHKHKLLDKSHHFIISGLVEWHLEEIYNVFQNTGYKIEEQLQTNEWVTIYFSK